MIGIEGDDSSVYGSLSWRYIHSTTLWFLKRHSDLFEIYYVLRSYSYTQKRKLKQLINQTNITSRQLGFTHLRAPTDIKPDEFYAPSTASVSLSRIHLYHLISKARRQTDHSVRQLVSGSVTNKIVLTHPLFGFWSL